MGPHSLPPHFVLEPPNAVDEDAIQPEDSAAIRSLDIAIQILEQEAGIRRLQPTQQQLLARCLRERVHDNLVQRTNVDAAREDRALELLNSLVATYPENADYKFDVVETLGEFSVFANTLDLSVCEAAGRRLRDAIALGGSLVVQRPDVASYALVVTHAHFKLGMVLARQANGLSGATADQKRLAAVGSITKALDGISGLIARFPEATGFAVWKAFFLAKKGELLGQQSRYAESEAELVESLELLDALREDINAPIVDQLTIWAQTMLEDNTGQIR